MMDLFEKVDGCHTCPLSHEVRTTLVDVGMFCSFPGYERCIYDLIDLHPPDCPFINKVKSITIMLKR